MASARSAPPAPRWPVEFWPVLISALSGEPTGPSAFAQPGLHLPPQFGELLRQHHTLERRRLVQSVGLLLQQRQIVQRIEDHLFPAVTARVPRNHLTVVRTLSPRLIKGTCAFEILVYLLSWLAAAFEGAANLPATGSGGPAVVTGGDSARDRGVNSAITQN